LLAIIRQLQKQPVDELEYENVIAVEVSVVVVKNNLARY